jgi:nicotinamide-nucleotide amidase
MRDLKATILSIGDELALGQTVDTNTAWLAAQLAQRGISAPMHLTIADDRPAIAEAFRHAAERADLLIATGGLGPTEDDLTRFALADVLGVELTCDDTAVAQIRDFFERRGRQMIDRNRVQAMCPAGATMLRNDHGTAPGIHLRISDADVYCLPGVPREMKAMFADHILPALPQQQGRVILTRKINTFGEGESNVAERLGEKLLARDRNPLVGTTVSDGIVSIRIRSEYATPDEAQQQLDQTTAAIRDALGPLVFGEDEQNLAQVVGNLLAERRQTIVTAESCTGGLLGKLLTDAEGASEFFLGAFTTYANAMKHAVLGVPESMLAEHGAVSEPVAQAMAEGALRISGADHAISTTGIAGPTGGTADKPVGTVYMAIASRNEQTQVHRHVFAGPRDVVRERTANMTLNQLRLRLISA